MESTTHVIECSHCGELNEPADAVQCGQDCGSAYCGDACADAHWVDAAHWELCGRSAGGNRGGRGHHSGTKWIARAHLKKGALTRTAKRHHMSVPQFERYAEHKERAHPHSMDPTTMKRVHLAETFAHMKKK